jgi:hypothetical protein
LLAGSLWYPAHISVHNGQVTPLLTGLLALGMARPPFWRGLCVGLCCAIKPTFLPMAPFAAIAFGPYAALGILAGGCGALLPPSWFVEYLHFVPEISSRTYGPYTLMYYLGTPVCMFLIAAPSLVVALTRRHCESTYVVLIGITTIGTALWVHSYTPLVLPLCYGIGYYAGSGDCEMVES